MEQINIDKLAKGIVSGLKESDLIPKEEIKESLSSNKLDFSKTYKKPITLLQIIEEKFNKDILTIDNISLTIGGAKSKKTFFSTMILSTLLGYKEYGMIGNRLNKNIVFFDTEQAHYHVQKISDRLKNILKTDLKNIDMFILRPFAPEKRMAMIEHYLIDNVGNYSFVIIDGIVDLLYDFNDLHESKRLSTKLLEWSSKYHCHINVILHTNKDKAYARGHLGTELMNKSETVFRITKESDDVSTVECEASRNMGFTKFEFNIENGLPVRNNMPTNFYNNIPEVIDDTKGLTTNNFYEKDNTEFLSKNEEAPF